MGKLPAWALALMLPSAAHALASITDCFISTDRVCEAPGWYQWFALYPHMFWIYMGMGSVFNDGELYLILLSYGYLEEQLVWTIVSKLAGLTIDRLIVSPNLTLEMELCGAFAGVIAFHVFYYRYGLKGVVSSKSAFLLCILTPAVLAQSSVTYDGNAVETYVLYYLLGFANGVRRGYHMKQLLYDRYELVMSALYITRFLQVTDTVILRAKYSRGEIPSIFIRIGMSQHLESLAGESKSQKVCRNRLVHRHVTSQRFIHIMREDAWTDPNSKLLHWKRNRAYAPKHECIV